MGGLCGGAPKEPQTKDAKQPNEKQPLIHNKGKSTSEPKQKTLAPKSTDRGKKTLSSSQYRRLSPQKREAHLIDTHQRYLPHKELRGLIETFKKYSEELGSVNKETFNNMITDVYTHMEDELRDNYYFADPNNTDQLFEIFDFDKNGTIDIQEFVAGVSLIAKGTVEERAEVLFSAIDLDRNGRVSKPELESFFRKALHSTKNFIQAQLSSTDPGYKVDDSIKEQGVDAVFQRLEVELANTLMSQATSDDASSGGDLTEKQFKEFYAKNDKIFEELAVKTAHQFIRAEQ